MRRQLDRVASSHLFSLVCVLEWTKKKNRRCWWCHWRRRQPITVQHFFLSAWTGRLPCRRGMLGSWKRRPSPPHDNGGCVVCHVRRRAAECRKRMLGVWNMSNLPLWLWLCVASASKLDLVLLRIDGIDFVFANNNIVATAVMTIAELSRASRKGPPLTVLPIRITKTVLVLHREWPLQRPLQWLTRCDTLQQLGAQQEVLFAVGRYEGGDPEVHTRKMCPGNAGSLQEAINQFARSLKSFFNTLDIMKKQM